MKRNYWQGLLALGLSLLLVQLPTWGANTLVGKVVPGAGISQLNGIQLKFESTLYSGDTLSTQADSGAMVLLPEGDQIHLGPAAALTVSEKNGALHLSLERGRAAARTGHTGVSLAARGLLIRASGPAFFQVTMEKEAVLVTSQQGDLQVQGRNQSFVVPSGKAMRFVLARNVAPGRTGAGANNLNELAIWIVIVATGAAIGAGFALENHNESQVPVSPSTP